LKNEKDKGEKLVDVVGDNSYGHRPLVTGCARQTLPEARANSAKIVERK